MSAKGDAARAPGEARLLSAASAVVIGQNSIARRSRSRRARRRRKPYRDPSSRMYALCLDEPMCVCSMCQSLCHCLCGVDILLCAVAQRRKCDPCCLGRRGSDVWVPV